jgi:hypothetical protein
MPDGIKRRSSGLGDMISRSTGIVLISVGAFMFGGVVLKEQAVYEQSLARETVIDSAAIQRADEARKLTKNPGDYYAACAAVFCGACLATGRKYD